MTLLWTFLGGLLVGAALMAPGLRYLTRELKVAQERLLAAWERGAIIPDRPDTPVTGQPALDPLPAALQAEVDQWESLASRMATEAVIRRQLADWGEARTIRWYSEAVER